MTYRGTDSKEASSELAIRQVKAGGSDGPDVSNGANTTHTKLFLSGTAVANGTLDLLDKGVSIYEVIVDQTGQWTQMIGDQTRGHHTYTVKDKTDGQSSSPWTLRIIAPLVMDIRAAELAGLFIRHVDRAVIEPPEGTSMIRTPSAGEAPYRYRVSNASIVELNAATGRIVSLRNGSTVVTVTDSAGQSAAYSVTVRNVSYIKDFGPERYDRQTMDVKAVEEGGVVPTLEQWDSLRSVYDGDPGGYTDDYYWTSSTHPWGSRWLKNPVSGVTYGENDNGKVACMGVLLPAN